MSTRRFHLPDLGEGLTEAEVLRWLVQVGDTVAVDQPVVEVETAKASVEVPTPYAGVVAELHAAEGGTVDVGAPLISIAAAAPAPASGDVLAAGSVPGSASGDVLAAGSVPGSASGDVLATGSAPGSASGDVLAAGSVPGSASGDVLAAGSVPGSASGDVLAAGSAPGSASGDVLAAGSGSGDGPADGSGSASGGALAGGSASGDVLAGRSGSTSASGSASGHVLVGRSRSAAGDAAVGGSASRDVVSGEAASGNVLVGYGTVDGRRTRRGRRRTALATAPVGGTRPLVISPIVRKLARDHHVDLTTIRGTAPGGVIARRDVERAIAGSASPAAPALPLAPPAPASSLPLPVRERIPLRGTRKAVADRLTLSRREIPDATTWVDVDATELVVLRRRMLDRDPGSPVGILAFVARFVVAGLARYPDLNSRVDLEAGEVLRLDGVNLGIAAQGERGLVVPVVRDAHRRNVRELHGEIARLAGAARSGDLSVADLTGGTFTLNNYGVFNVDGATPIINHPEVALLGVGRILDRPWVVDGEVVPRKIAQFSLTFDHRVCDGGTAAGFLRFVVDCVENPAEALASI